MSEGVFNVVALGAQASLATAVPASTVFPVDAGFGGFALDRSAQSPDEDWGSTSREQPGRSSTGLRSASASMPFIARFEDLHQILASHVSSVSTPVGTAAPYTWAYTFDETGSSLASALRVRTVEYGVDGSTQDEWRATGAIVNQLQLGFDALTAPGNAVWKGSADWVAVTREANALTGTAVAPSVLETMEGHLTTLAEGPVATAFTSLATATATLKSFQLTSNNSAVLRAYGGASDTASDIGRSAKGEVTFTAMVAIGTATKADVLDVFAVAGSVPTERRWRIAVAGSGTKSLTIDFRCRFTAVDVGLQESERLYQVNGVWIRDATLGGRGTLTLKNGVATLA